MGSKDDGICSGAAGRPSWFRLTLLAGGVGLLSGLVRFYVFVAWFVVGRLLGPRPRRDRTVARGARSYICAFPPSAEATERSVDSLGGVALRVGVGESHPSLPLGRGLRLVGVGSRSLG